MPAPRLGVAALTGLVPDPGEATDENVAQFLRDHMEEFREFVMRVLTVPPRQV